MTNKKDVRVLSENDLLTIVTDLGQPSFRAKQINEWIWQKGALSFDEMSNLPAEFRAKLNEAYVFLPLIVDVIQESNDGTIKLRAHLHDGHAIESVLIPVVKSNRYTVCVSSQAGCSLSCSFCATGKMGLLRQLTAAEIVDQVRFVNTICLDKYDHPLTNIVYMGMGEPLLNYKETKRSIDIISSPMGLHMSAKRITVSTAGIAKMIIKLADDNVRHNLALSLHAPSDEKRNTIMSINETNNLSKLMEALNYFHTNTNNRISYEYIALKDFNVSRQDARDLIALCKDFPVQVNIIEYNPIGDGLFDSAGEDAIDAFANQLTLGGVRCTVRRSRGKDIDAACGQLANK